MGRSFGGMIIAGVADRVPERFARAIMNAGRDYAAGFYADDGVMSVEADGVAGHRRCFLRGGMRDRTGKVARLGEPPHGYLG